MMIKMEKTELEIQKKSFLFFLLFQFSSANQKKQKTNLNFHKILFWWFLTFSWNRPIGKHQKGVEVVKQIILIKEGREFKRIG